MLLPRELFEDTRETIFGAPCLSAKDDAISPCLMEFDDVWSSVQGHGCEADGLRQRKTQDDDCTVEQHRLIVEHWQTMSKNTDAPHDANGQDPGHRSEQLRRDLSASATNHTPRTL